MQERKEKEELKRQKDIEDNKTQFFEMLKTSKDLADNLPALAEFLQKHTNATGVYIGRLQFPDCPIKIDADDKAHFDDTKPKVIKFIHASSSHAFMEGAVLQPKIGVTHEVFRPNFTRLPKTQVVHDDEGNEKTVEIDLLQRFKHIYVPEVVREPRMNFQRVPKLGSFLAVPLVYKSCLFDEALTEAVINWQEVMQKRAAQEQEREHWEAAQN